MFLGFVINPNYTLTVKTALIVSKTFMFVFISTHETAAAFSLMCEVLGLCPASRTLSF